MKVLVVGSGAREHALAWKISQSPMLTKLLCAPGNPGMESIAECLPIKPTDIAGVIAAASSHEVDLVVVGPEDPLAAGIVDRLGEAGIRAFGPSGSAARLEASKSFAKGIMERHGIPTARCEVVISMDEAMAALDHWSFPLAFKADGLAAGKGVIIAATRTEAEDALRLFMVDRTFGDRGDTVVLEEFLEGEEVSLIGLSDGKRILPLAPAEDHKQVFDGDRGPNTGGMGCFSPVPAFSPERALDVAGSVLQRAVDAMAEEGCPLRGALFAGLMLTRQGPRVLEFNVRFGDPETEVVLPRMKSDLLPLLAACAAGDLGSASIEWHDEPAVTVILASGGYPGRYETGKPILGLGAVTHIHEQGDPVQVFHAGTRRDGDRIVTAGGRVLAVTALGPTLEIAAQRAYQAADQISFEGMHRRNDIARWRLSRASSA
jgi:phosphoribosylamine--glycine ligase